MASGQNIIELYKSRAHVFQINPETKNSWLAKGEQAIPISIVTLLKGDEGTNEASRRELKIIGTNDQTDETVLDAPIFPKTTFTKRSQKFGQWIDHTGTVYGLGFNSENELTEFVDNFHRLQRDILSPPMAYNQNPQQPQQHPSSSSLSSVTNMQPQSKLSLERMPDLIQQQHNNISETTARFQASNTNSMHQQYSNTLAHPGHHQQQLKRQQQQAQLHNQSNGNADLNNNGNNSFNSASSYTRSQSVLGLQSKQNNSNNNGLVNSRTSPETNNSLSTQSEWQLVEQLKYENERLKQALEESSKNTAIWNNELLNLRTNNVKLTQALQESKAHVEEWERELLGLRDENKELKLRVKALSSASDPEKGEDYQKDLQKYKDFVDEVQVELRRKEDEIEELQSSLQELELKTRESKQNGQFNDSSAQFTMNYNQLKTFNAKLESKVKGLLDLQRELEHSLSP